jgi:hypothetical protein
LLSSLQILVSNLALIAITAYVAHFGIEALAGYGLAARVELLISSMVLALGVGTTTMVGTCVGAGLEARARRVTLVSCLLAAAIFAAIGLGVAFSGRSIAGLFTNVEGVVSAAAGYFYATRLVCGYGRICDTVFRLSGMGTGDGSATCQPVEGCYRTGRRMDAAAASASARLAVLSCGRFHGYWSVNTGHGFRNPAAKSTRFDAFRLKS